jgi:hypothetical protein
MANPNLLALFRDEVLLTGPESSLPSNLSQFWLEELQNHLERYFDGLNSESDAEEKDLDISLPLAAIIHILFAKNGGEEISESSEKLYEYFQDYRLELALKRSRERLMWLPRLQPLRPSSPTETSWWSKAPFFNRYLHRCHRRRARSEALMECILTTAEISE